MGNVSHNFTRTIVFVAGIYLAACGVDAWYWLLREAFRRDKDPSKLWQHVSEKTFASSGDLFCLGVCLFLPGLLAGKPEGNSVGIYMLGFLLGLLFLGTSHNIGQARRRALMRRLGE